MLHFGAFEDPVVSSAARMPSAVAQVGTCCCTPQIITGHLSASATLPLCPQPSRPARIQLQPLAKASIYPELPQNPVIDKFHKFPLHPDLG